MRSSYRTYPDATIRKVFELRRRGLTFRDISARLGETMEHPPAWELVRKWIHGRTVQAQLVMGEMEMRRHG